MNHIQITGLSYAYPGQDTYAVENINTEIEQGEFLCLIGHSGCGKSTLLSLLAGLIKPDAGAVLLGSEPLPGPGTDRALVFQHYSLFPWMTVRKNVVFGLKQRQKHLSKSEAVTIAEEFLAKVGMAEAQHKYPHQLSGGMRQRVAIARALAMDSPILLLDEPFGALDTKRRQELQQLLADLWHDGREKKTVIFVTHDIDEAILLADRILFMEPGRITADIPVTLTRPRNPSLISASHEYKLLKNKLVALFYGSETAMKGASSL